MISSSSLPPWLSEAGDRRLREVRNIIDSRAPFSPEFATSLVEDVAALYRLATELRRCANAYAPSIARLSPELIHNIFAHVAELEPAKTSSLGWIRLGHVSSNFRSILLGMRSLWASAVCQVSSRASHELFARAGGTPISIELEDEEEPIDRTRIEFAMSNIHVARCLSIDEYHTYSTLWTLEPRSMSGAELPVLEDLSVDVIHRPQHDADWFGTDIYDLEPMRAHRLRAVHLSNIFIPFPAENLTTLNLIRTQCFEEGSIPNKDSVLPTPEQFLGILGRCVNVMNLWLQDTIPAVTPLPAALRPCKAIQLPSLKKTVIYATLSRISAIWSHLLVPPGSRLEMKPDNVDFPASFRGFVDRNRLSFLALFEDHIIQGDHPPAALAVEISSTEHYQTQCGFFCRTPDFISDSWEGLPIYSADAEFGEAYEPLLDVWFSQCIWDSHVSFKDLIDSIPLAFLTLIDTLDVGGVAEKDLHHLFSRLPRLHTLHLRDVKSGALGALLPPIGRQGRELPKHYLPHLRHLRLVNADFSDTPSDSTVSYEEVIDIVTERVFAGIPLMSLKIEGASLVDTDQSEFDTFITHLGEFVPSVEIIEVKTSSGD